MKNSIPFINYFATLFAKFLWLLLRVLNYFVFSWEFFDLLKLLFLFLIYFTILFLIPFFCFFNQSTFHIMYSYSEISFFIFITLMILISAHSFILFCDFVKLILNHKTFNSSLNTHTINMNYFVVFLLLLFLIICWLDDSNGIS